MTEQVPSRVATDPGSGHVERSVVIPTYDERENIGGLVDAIAAALAEAGSFEVIVVDDDSPDGTWRLVDELAEDRPWLRCLRRIGRRGLSSAVLEGFELARGRRLAVIDGDGQHDETKLPALFAALDEAPLAVGSRYVEGGGTSSWSLKRKAASKGATWMARCFLRVPLSDPMSGFFALRREVYEEVAEKLNPRGFKILLEIAFRAKIKQVVEVPFVFKPRERGESKLSAGVIVDYLAALWDLRFGKILPLSFLRYALVGLSGVGVTQGILWLLHYHLEWSKYPSYAIAIGVAMVTNFLLNNFWTFRKLAKRSIGGLVTGLLMFAAICGVGALVNYSVTHMVDLMFETHLGRDDLIWVAAFFGIAVATIWNYGFSKRLVWKE